MYNHIYHVITPFSRWPLLVPFVQRLRGLAVQWHPIFDDDTPVRIETGRMPGDRLHIYPLYCPARSEGWFTGYWKTNWFFDHYPIEDRHRYLILNDDDAYEEGFFEKIDAVEGELLVCSMGRGHNEVSGNPHPPGILTACRDNLKIGHVGGEQLVVSGRLMREERYAKHYEADGELILRLAQNVDPVFVPDARVYFNFFEPGRWTLDDNGKPV